MSLPLVWLIGSSRLPLLAEVAAWLPARVNLQQSETPARLISDQKKQVTSRQFPDLVILLPTHAGQINPADVQSLLAYAPLATVVSLGGPWSEGELRTAPLPPGVKRILWHEWQLRLEDELLALEKPKTSAVPPNHWHLPRTSTPLDRQLWQANQKVSLDTLPLVAIHSRNWSDFEALADGLRGMAVKSVWLSSEQPLPIQRADLLLWHCRSELPGELPELQLAMRRVGDPPTIALAHFARPEELALAAKCQITAVLAQPLVLLDLLSAVERLLLLHPSNLQSQKKLQFLPK